MITTYNRPQILQRAIKSVLAQGVPDLEVIVVDDASTVPVQPVVERFPGVRYARQEQNTGPGPARNRGIAMASRPYVVLLDDDDELVEGALRTIAEMIGSFAERDRYPVFQFGHGNAKLAGAFRLIRLGDYLTGVLKGDFLPVIHRDRFCGMGFAYPDLRIGAEHLLWWEIADKVGIPTWAENVCILHSDAPSRLTAPANQIARAREYAEMQELTLERFGEVLKERFPAAYRARKIGAATYWLLAGERRRARTHLSEIAQAGGGLVTWIVRAVSYLPDPLVRWAFKMYRSATR